MPHAQKQEASLKLENTESYAIYLNLYKEASRTNRFTIGHVAKIEGSNHIRAFPFI